MCIAWKDVFKPRYAVIVQIARFPAVLDSVGRPSFTYSPVVKQLVVRRPFYMPFNEFYNELSNMNNMVFCGSKKTLSKLYGIGSCNKLNLKNTQYIK